MLLPLIVNVPLPVFLSLPLLLLPTKAIIVPAKFVLDDKLRFNIDPALIHIDVFALAAKVPIDCVLPAIILKCPVFVRATALPDANPWSISIFNAPSLIVVPPVKVLFPVNVK